MLKPVPAVLAISAILGAATAQSLGPVPVPKENPLTPEKAILGKALFWDEQLSSDGSMACGTCHRPGSGGSDPRTTRNAGLDGELLTPDDGFGSPGIRRKKKPSETDTDTTPTPDSFLAALIDTDAAVTPRIAPSNLTAQWAPELFWDGRARSEFRDPRSGDVVIASGGALESQALQPIMNTAEMSHVQRTWADVTASLTAARPLALATNLPPDLKTALEARPSYPQLFEAAFGDPTITPVRIAFALASYQRTLVPDQTAYDRFAAGDDTALTDNQKRGLRYLRQFGCAECHKPPLFTDNSFRNVGVRPAEYDPGRQAVTKDPQDRGKFKVPSLRNVFLRPRLTHAGRFDAVNATMRIYRWPRRDPQIDPLLRSGRDVNHRANDSTPMMDFMKNALTDPRVAAETPPFDRPTLRSERTAAK